jgi:hypothetical protein
MFEWLKKKFQKQVVIKETGIDYNSTEPEVAIVSSGLDPARGIKLELDWNDAFIQYLKGSGFDGVDDETIVQKWLATIYKDLALRIKPGTNFE